MTSTQTNVDVVRSVAGNHSLEWLIGELDRQRRSAKRIVTTNGCFDLLHPGHVAFLNEARKCGDLLIVLLNSDDSVRRLKGPTRPIVEQEGRANVLLGLRAVDYAVFFDEQLPSNLLGVIRPDIHCKASDYLASDLPEAAVVEQAGGQVRILPFVNGYSTTRLAERMLTKSSTSVESDLSADAAQVRQTLLAGAQVLTRVATDIAAQLAEVAQMISAALKAGHKVLVCGNGGSASDSQHFAAELVGRYRCEREAWPAIALTVDTSILTAVGNDYGFEQIFSRQIEALGSTGDVLLAISTSGNSPNVLAAIETANANGIRTVGLTGSNQSRICRAAQICLQVPSTETSLIQQAHIAMLHVLCEFLENKHITDQE